MNWEGFGIARPVSDDELRELVNRFFGVAPSRIVVAGLADELPYIAPEQFGAIVRRSLSTGEFPLWVEIQLKDRARDDEMETMRELARVLGSALMVSDDTVNPYRWLRVWPDGRTEVIFVDTEALNDRDEVVVRRVEPYEGRSLA
jgi:hypothetical protein